MALSSTLDPDPDLKGLTIGQDITGLFSPLPSWIAQGREALWSEHTRKLISLFLSLPLTHSLIVVESQHLVTYQTSVRKLGTLHLLSTVMKFIRYKSRVLWPPQCAGVVSGCRIFSKAVPGAYQ
jgi:hypothetical protein